MSSTERDALTPKAVAGIRKLRKALEKDNPRFQAAVEAGQGANAFVQSVRADLAKCRDSARVSQADVGRRLDLGQPAISKIENGSGDLSLKTLYRFAEAIGYRPVVQMVPAAHAAASARAENAGTASGRPYLDMIVPSGAFPPWHTATPYYLGAEAPGYIEAVEAEVLRRITDVLPEALAAALLRLPEALATALAKQPEALAAAPSKQK
jgi:transcriptional regulator with XRE-family HTH domain